ncbi:MAG: endonuclease III [Gemmatimonadaceae bacterium]|nr:endonuclease III [Gemmatimonadaceae bacterium]
MATRARTDKRPFDIPRMLRRIEEAIRPYPPAAMFALADLGYRSLFEQLVGCVISVRTRDEVSLPTSIRLFEVARTPAAMMGLSVTRIDSLIRASTFHEAKARDIHTLARRTMTELGGTLPCDGSVLTSFHGIGPKCANLALGIACGHGRPAVDVHVHRITNRWGIIHTRTPEETMEALEGVVERRDWVRINRLLVPFGKHICTARRPRCSSCVVNAYCRQIGVVDYV